MTSNGEGEVRPSEDLRNKALSDMQAFADCVRKKVGKPVELQRLQTGGPKIAPDALTGRKLRTLRGLYAEDFIAYGDCF